MKRILVSIAIVNYNNKKEMEKCLPSIYRSEGSIELETFVCDNNSTDGSPEMLEAKFPQIHLIKNTENMGLSKGMNIILERVTGDYVLFLDSDTELKAGALEDLMSFLSTHLDVGIVGSRVYSPDGTIQETARRFPNLLSGLFGRRALVRRLFPNNPISGRFMCLESINQTEPFEVDYVSAACMMMKREVVERIGSMDENFFVYWTDVDWCRRAKNSSYKIFCVPSAKVVHYERYQPLKRKNPKMIIDFHKGAYLYYRKHNVGHRASINNIFAMSVLFLRMVLHLCLNQFKNRNERVR